MTGFAPRIDSSGNSLLLRQRPILEPRLHNWGETVLKLSPGLDKVLSHFTPASYHS